MVKTIEDVNINTEEDSIHLHCTYSFQVYAEYLPKKIACSKCEQISKDNKSYRV